MFTVHVFTYSHRYGTDISVYSTRHVALQNAAFIALEWLDDFRECATEEDCEMLLQAIKSSRYEEVVTLWNKTMEEETMEIVEHAVSTPDVDISKTLEGILASIERDAAEQAHEEEQARNASEV